MIDIASVLLVQTPFTFDASSVVTIGSFEVEWSLRDNPMHFTLPANLMHHSLPDNPMHHTLPARQPA